MKKLIKKLLIVTVVVAMVVTAMPLTGIDFSDLFTVKTEAASAINRAGDYEVRRGSNYVYITKYCGNDVDVVIPSELKGKPVVGIQEDCFSGSSAADATPEQQACAKIKSVTIPETVEDIGARAFKGCVSLEKINFSEGLYDIDASAFEDCEKLTKIKAKERKCNYKAISQEKLENQVYEMLMFKLFPNEEAIRAYVDFYVEKKSNDNYEQKQIAQYEKQLKSVQKKIDNIMMAVIQGIGIETAKDYLAPLEEDKKQLNKLIDQAKNS